VRSGTLCDSEIGCAIRCSTRKYDHCQDDGGSVNKLVQQTSSPNVLFVKNSPKRIANPPI
jgi:hypothetical protein